MKEILILPLTKSPHRKGRIGPEYKQDWFRGLIAAANIQKSRGGKILVISDVHITGQIHEAEMYTESLRSLGIAMNNIIVIRQALETIGQLEIATRYAEEKKLELVVISTFLHYPRVRWLCRGRGFKHYKVYGIPRPAEALTDILFTFLFPILDLAGLREKFTEKIRSRRISGKH